jgi:hypothetical protein
MILTLMFKFPEDIPQYLWIELNENTAGDLNLYYEFETDLVFEANRFCEAM